MTTILTRRVLPTDADDIRNDLKTLASAVSAGPLGLGKTGDAVKVLQSHLSAAGLYSGPVNGTFDAATEAALKSFQKAKKLDATGKFDVASFKQLKTIDTFVKDGFETKAVLNQRGKDILSAERHMAKLGFLKQSEADGVYDADTAKATAWYRKADKQVEDGVKGIGSTFYKELKKASASYNHDAYRHRDLGTKGEVAQHKRLDDATSKQAAAAGGIHRGEEGRAVLNVQKHLESAGYELGDQNSKFGARTEAALRNFQKKVKLPETGVVDTATWKALRKSNFATTSRTSPAQELNERSGSVKRTEKMLHTLGRKGFKVDGIYDKGLKATVARFQKNHDLKVTGEVDTRTDKAITAAYEKKIHTVRKPPVVWKPSPNYGSRYGTDIDAVILHHTASNNTAGDLATLRSRAAEVSAHYLVGNDGKIYQLVKDQYRAWHAGVSAIRGDSTPDVNSRSIGIEITNAGDGHTPFTEGQYKALEKLVPYLMKTYKVPLANLLGHKDIAPGRKIDPASNFNFERIRKAVRQSR